MAMEISVKGSNYQIDYADRLQAEREEAKKAENRQSEEKAAEQRPVQQDAYISSEKSDEKPNGLYYVGQDENGNKKVYFNDPKKAGKADDKKKPKVNANNPENSEEKCVGNTDKVEREIKELKEKKKRLEAAAQAGVGRRKEIEGAGEQTGADRAGTDSERQ